MTTRDKTNEGIAHRMVRCVGRAVKSFLDSDPKIRDLKYINEILKEKNELMQEETKQLRKVHDYLRKEVKAGRLIYRRAANATAAAAPTAAAPDRARAPVSTVPVSRKNINDGIAHHMGQRVSRSTNSFLPIDRVRQLEELTRMFQENHMMECKMRQKQKKQHRKIKPYLENKLKARGLTYVPPANASTIAVMAEMVDMLNAYVDTDVANMDADV